MFNIMKKRNSRNLAHYAAGLHCCSAQIEYVE